MYRSKGDMVSPMYCLCLLVALHFTLSDAGPVGPLPNVTSLDLGLKEGSCALGDVVYLPGDEFPGASACERCVCQNSQVRCEKQRCEPRPGCKAVHRPDHCCPTYQCECEQEGRVYGNGEKLVDPQDPCRVCYCQGGEVVCRRIACFVRDDCQPRVVQGRCCPEYDNCPLRGVTSVHGVTTASTTLPPKVNASAVLPHPGPIKPGFTIKEITPVSEIPVTDVKVKEILPSPNMDVDEYSSSKSPLIPREVTSETASIGDANVKARLPVIVDTSEQKAVREENAHDNDNGDSTPSKISFSTQDSINSEIYPSNIPSLILMGPPSETISLIPLSTKTPADEEDPSLFDHNPAFPPIPDDLSVLSNHEDEILPEQHFENDQIPGISDIMGANDRIITDAPIIRESPTKIVYMTKELTETTDKLLGTEVSSEKNINKIDGSSWFRLTTKENPMINLRSVLPTQILNIPSFIADETTDDIDTTTDDFDLQSSSDRGVDINFDGQDRQNSSNDSELHRTQSPVFSSTEIAMEHQPSSILIETSDQNPHDGPDNISDSMLASSTVSTLNVETVSDMESGKETSFENIETTEFILASFGSQESATEAVELVKMSINNDKSSALIEPSQERKNNVLTDLINLVGDVASISDHTDNPTKSVAGSTTISDSEELIPVNLGYKSKNNNWNLNSITEIPHKSKNMQPSKTKNVEIEDDDEIESITDSPPPNDKIEPTTKRPIIDNVTDGKTRKTNGTVENKDSEMITQVYVPTIGKPTKVVMGDSNEVISGAQLTDRGNATSAVSDEERDSKHSMTSSSPEHVESTLSEEETTDQPLESSLAQ